MPAAGVYFVFPARIAASAARQMCSGVGKSGSPTDRSMTSTPEAASAWARAAMASVAEGSSACIRVARARGERRAEDDGEEWDMRVERVRGRSR